MLGLMALALTLIMIFSLVKNALMGKQLSKDDHFQGRIDVLFPITTSTEFYLEAWLRALATYKMPSDFLKFHILIDGLHTSHPEWEELKTKCPYIEIYHFSMRPAHAEPSTWMIDQIRDKIQGDVVIVGDPELVASEQALISIAKNVKDHEKSYYVLPQTSKDSRIGELITCLNPTMAFASFFGKSRWRRYLTQPLVGISQGWMSMTLKTFNELDFKSIRISNWKEAITTQWDEKEKRYYLAFGEKLLLRHYPIDGSFPLPYIEKKWLEMWIRSNKKSFWFFVSTLFIWSFPVIFFISRPFWAMASFGLLLLYRFFTKIVFQESLTAVLLHPVGCLAWIVGLIKFGIHQFKGARN